MPFPKNEIIRILESSLQSAKVAVDDLTGTADHYRVVIVSDEFNGKRLLQRHQLVNAALAEPLKGPIHALTIEAYTEEEWKSRSQ